MRGTDADTTTILVARRYLSVMPHPWVLAETEGLLAMLPLGIAIDYLSSTFDKESTMARATSRRRDLLVGAAAAAYKRGRDLWRELTRSQEDHMTTVSFTKTQPPRWLLDFWKEIDDKTFGKGFDCFTRDAICNLGVADWHGREAIRENLRKFIDTGFTAHHEVLEYWDGESLMVFRGTVTMTPDDKTEPAVHPTMTHFFYMDKAEPTKVSHWYGAVGPVAF